MVWNPNLLLRLAQSRRQGMKMATGQLQAEQLESKVMPLPTLAQAV